MHKTILITVTSVISALTISGLYANTIGPGTTAAPDAFTNDTGLTLLATTGAQNLNPAPTAFNATVQEWVYANTSGTSDAGGGTSQAGLCNGCLDFFFLLSNAGPGIIERLSSSLAPGFSGFNTDVGYNASSIAGGPTAPAVTATTGIAPGTVDRSADGSVIGFNYTNNNLTSGESTALLEIQTDALYYVPGTLSIQDGVSANGIGFAPNATPEPGTMALLGLGFIGIGALKSSRRRKSA